MLNIVARTPAEARDAAELVDVDYEELPAALDLREALGNKMPLCADANGGLTLADAKRYIERTRTAKLAYVEQPLPRQPNWDVCARRTYFTVTRSSARLALTISRSF